jgi:hypothetical protein
MHCIKIRNNSSLSAADGIQNCRRQQGHGISATSKISSKFEDTVFRTIGNTMLESIQVSWKTCGHSSLEEEMILSP